MRMNFRHVESVVLVTFVAVITKTVRMVNFSTHCTASIMPVFLVWSPSANKIDKNCVKWCYKILAENGECAAVAAVARHC